MYPVSCIPGSKPELEFVSSDSGNPRTAVSWCSQSPQHKPTHPGSCRSHMACQTLLGWTPSHQISVGILQRKRTPKNINNSKTFYSCKTPMPKDNILGKEQWIKSNILGLAQLQGLYSWVSITEQNSWVSTAWRIKKSILGNSNRIRATYSLVRTVKRSKSATLLGEQS